MLGAKMYKRDFNELEYKKIADWCNEHNCTIENKGEFYEVVEVDTSELEDKFKKENLQSEITDINLQISELRGVSECAISVDGINEYNVFVGGKLVTMKEEEFIEYFDTLTNKRSELLQQYKELK